MNHRVYKDRVYNFTLDSPEVRYLCDRDAILATAIRYVGDLKYRLHPEPYLFIVETIIGQMLSNKVSDIICQRFEDLCCGNVNPQAVLKLSANEFRNIGLSKAKTEYIINFTKYIATDIDYFNGLSKMQDDEVISKLTSIRGLGPWSAKMFLMFVLNRQDVLPHEDGAFVQAVEWLYGIKDKTRTHIALKSRFANWKPYSTLAARYLYRALDGGMMKSNATGENVKKKGTLKS